VFPGTWVDINLETFYATAYENDVPVYAAIITAGRDGRTPIGQFQVNRRVLNETMDSATVGIPEGDPEYYFLEDVSYTQYFLAGGYAIHENYWSSPAAYGRFSSNGCVGLLYDDAAWFWGFLDIGSHVHIHFGGQYLPGCSSDRGLTAMLCIFAALDVGGVVPYPCRRRELRLRRARKISLVAGRESIRLAVDFCVDAVRSILKPV
jgi:hypothetical protein